MGGHKRRKAARKNSTTDTETSTSSNDQDVEGRIIQTRSGTRSSPARSRSAPSSFAVDMDKVDEMSCIAQNARKVTEIIDKHKLVQKPGFILYNPNDNEIESKLKLFEGIEENIYLTRTKLYKENSRQKCECLMTMTKEEYDNGAVGCKDIYECQNRMLYIECDKSCRLGPRCDNKGIQNKITKAVVLFKTVNRGYGLKTLVKIKKGAFIIEYVGEVIALDEFKKRSDKYHAEGRKDHYFMVYDRTIMLDATLKGNSSRFANHSCKPNCQMQPFYVNGKIRLGLFALNKLKIDEEITYDYGVKNSGDFDQTCLCGSVECRGQIWKSKSDENDKTENNPNQKKKPQSGNGGSNISKASSSIIPYNNPDSVSKRNITSTRQINKGTVAPARLPRISNIKKANNFLIHSPSQKQISPILSPLTTLPKSTCSTTTAASSQHQQVSIRTDEQEYPPKPIIKDQQMVATTTATLPSEPEENTQHQVDIDNLPKSTCTTTTAASSQHQQVSIRTDEQGYSLDQINQDQQMVATKTASLPSEPQVEIDNLPKSTCTTTTESALETTHTIKNPDESQSKSSPEKGPSSPLPIIRAKQGASNTTCTICGNSFNRPADLDRHMNLHSDNPVLHECSVCGGMFKHSWDRNNHSKNCNGKAPTRRRTRALGKRKRTVKTDLSSEESDSDSTAIKMKSKKVKVKRKIDPTNSITLKTTKVIAVKDKDSVSDSWFQFFITAGIPQEATQKYVKKFAKHEMTMAMHPLSDTQLVRMGFKIEGHMHLILAYSKKVSEQMLAKMSSDHHDKDFDNVIIL